MRSSSRGPSRLASILLFLAISVCGREVLALDFSIVEVGLFYEPGAQLTGQSAWIETRSTGSTSSGLLNGVTNLGATYEFENSPAPSLTDYLTFSYVGIYQRPLFDTLGFPLLDGSGNQVIDRSLVIGFDDRNVALGRRLDELFPSISYTESALVDAMTSQIDAPEFLDLAFNHVAGQVATSSPIGLYEVTCYDESICSFPSRVRSTGDLYLIAFTGGANGDLGEDIGVVTYSIHQITTIPEPGTSLLMAIGLAGMSATRRRSESRSV